MGVGVPCLPGLRGSPKIGAPKNLEFRRLAHADDEKVNELVRSPIEMIQLFRGRFDRGQPYTQFPRRQGCRTLPTDGKQR
jgi:hypothetical protein